MTDVTDKKLVQSYNFADFLKTVVDAKQYGFVLDLTTQETYPRHIGAFYQVVLVRDAEQNTTQQPVTQPTTKRKAKGDSE